MTEHILTESRNHIGFITLDRPKALNSLSLDMVRALAGALLAWRDDAAIRAVVIRSTSEKAFCAGGDIRFFHEAGTSTPGRGGALIEDFFTEEYALNHLIHHYPKPYIAFMDGIVMGGGMGIAQAGPSNRMRIVTERTKMAMPEVNIGLFPDVGGSFFLSRLPGGIGNYLGVTGEVIGAADAIYAGLADVFVPSAQLPSLLEQIAATNGIGIEQAIRSFAAPFQTEAAPNAGVLAANRESIDRFFGQDSVPAIIEALSRDDSSFAHRTFEVMKKRSPLMMCVTLEQLRRGGALSVAECLRMERTMVRRCFEHGEVLEGVRALVIDKDQQPAWNPATLAEVNPEMIETFFRSAWPAHAHPLNNLD